MESINNNWHGLVLKLKSGIPGGSYHVIVETGFKSDENNKKVYGWNSFSNEFYETGKISEEAINMLQKNPDGGFEGSLIEKKIQNDEYSELSENEFKQFVQRIENNQTLKEFYKDVKLKRTRD